MNSLLTPDVKRCPYCRAPLKVAYEGRSERLVCIPCNFLALDFSNPLPTTDTRLTPEKTQRQAASQENKAKYEGLLSEQLEALGITDYETDYQFHRPRKWAADFAWPERKLLVEVEGGTWSAGRHTRGAGYASDCEKYNAASLAGWRVLRYVGNRVKDGSAAREIARELGIISYEEHEDIPREALLPVARTASGKGAQVPAHGQRKSQFRRTGGRAR